MRHLHKFNNYLNESERILFDGIQEMTEIKQQIQDENSPDWFLQWN